MKFKRLVSFFLTGILFGIIMSKSEAISWFRIHEMFRFESFHMYGIIGTGVLLGIITLQVWKLMGFRTKDGDEVRNYVMPLSPKRHLLAGTIFGLGWALIGACPGPIYVLIGHGFLIFIFVLIGAVAGTWIYAAIKHKLPH